MSKSARGGTTSPPVNAFDAACRALARRCLTVAELQERLKRRYPEEEVASAVGKLREYRYLDDDSLITDYIRDRMRFSPRSAELIEAELQRRGIESDHFRRIFDAEYPEYDEIEVARRAISPQMTLLKKTKAQSRREKALRFLRSRGFSYDVMMEVWEEIQKELKINDDDPTQYF
ncbi:MAG: regulatory protein RecX [bacterium]|nr:regulatory protein RecX [bacterium]